MASSLIIKSWWNLKEKYIITWQLIMHWLNEYLSRSIKVICQTNIFSVSNWFIKQPAWRRLVVLVLDSGYQSNWNLFSEIIFCKMQFILLVNSYIIMKFQWAVAISICGSQKIVPFSKAASLFDTTNYMSKQSNLQYSKLAKSRLFQYCPYIYIYIYIYYIYTQQIHRYIIYIHTYT